MKKKLPEEYKSRQIKSIFYTILLHIVFIFVFSLIKFYPQAEEEAQSAYGMELSYAAFIDNSDSDLIPIETVSEEDIEDIIPAPQEEKSLEEGQNVENLNAEDTEAENKKQEDDKNVEDSKKTSETQPSGDEESPISEVGNKDVSHNINNWNWENPPTVENKKNIDGFIEFQIVVDMEGNVVKSSILIWESNITDRDIIKMYKNAVIQTRFQPTDTEEKATENTKGIIRFDIKSK